MTIFELKRLVMIEVGNEASFAFINTRLILRTGVNLNQLDTQIEPGRFERALLELRAMGYLKEKSR
ncbi:MAG TPA: hypothetical protein VFF06_26370 [Polyangia bacterium]|nr:hypothetical protein [Polyangia bacterium]